MKNLVFGYVRVSSTDQNEERQLEDLRNAGVDERNIYNVNTKEKRETLSLSFCF